MKIFTLALTTLVLSACSLLPTRTVEVEKTVFKSIECPDVPQCTVPETLNIKTNGQLAQAFEDSQMNLIQCKISRDTLALCIEESKNILIRNN